MPRTETVTQLRRTKIENSDFAQRHILNALGIVSLIRSRAIHDGRPEDDALEGATHAITNELNEAFGLLLGD